MSVSTFTVPTAVQQECKLEREEMQCSSLHLPNPTTHPFYLRTTNETLVPYVGSTGLALESVSLGVTNGQQQQTLCPLPNQVEEVSHSHKYNHASAALVNLGNATSVTQQLNDRGALAAINIPYPPSVTNGAATAVLTFQPTGRAFVTAPAAGVWPLKLMQNASTMTEESELQSMPRIEPSHTPEAKEFPNNTTNTQNLEMQQRTTESLKTGGDHTDASDSIGDLDNDDEENDSDDSKSDTHKQIFSECQQIQLEQQGSAMAEYLSRLQPPQPMAMPLQHFLSYQAGETVETGATVEPINSKRPQARPGGVQLITGPDGSSLFSCPECQIFLPDSNQLDAHLQAHRAERRFVCNVCGACLKRKEHLDQHKKGHSDERPFVCTICFKGFKRNEHLTRHIVIHSGDKEHACSECGKRFSRKDHLHKHAQTHLARRMRNRIANGTVVGEVGGNITP